MRAAGQLPHQSSNDIQIYVYNRGQQEKTPSVSMVKDQFQ